MNAQESLAVRPPAVAGTFYPDDPAALAGMVDSFLAAAKSRPKAGTARPLPKAVIAPHAGYVYSGAVAGSAYAPLKPARELIKRIVLIGPAHRVAVPGLAVPSVDAFATPLGAVRLDRTAIEGLLRLDRVATSDRAHGPEHALEVQLPFLQRVFAEFSLIPLLAGAASPADVSSALEAVWGGPETLIVISSDLSHYLDYESARRLDGATMRAIEALDGTAIDDNGACGRIAIRGLLATAKRRGLTPRVVDLGNSGDTAGPHNRVVGYGAVLFEAGSAAEFSAAQRRVLLDAAAASIRAGLAGGDQTEIDVQPYPAPLRAMRASFVTLTRGNRLRGCIGSLGPRRPLVADVAWNAHSAAFADPRFRALRPKEYPRLDLGVSVLGRSAEIACSSEKELVASLRPGVDGLTLAEGGKRGTLLPQVWKSNPSALEFVRTVKRKAGLPEDYWSDTVRAWRYGAESFEEPVADIEARSAG